MLFPVNFVNCIFLLIFSSACAFFIFVWLVTTEGFWGLLSFFFFFSSTSLLLPTHLPPPTCTHAQSCNPMDFSPPDSSVHGFFQARILEWVAISFSMRVAIFTVHHWLLSAHNHFRVAMAENGRKVAGLPLGYPGTRPCSCSGVVKERIEWEHASINTPKRVSHSHAF